MTLFTRTAGHDRCFQSAGSAGWGRVSQRREETEALSDPEAEALTTSPHASEQCEDLRDLKDAVTRARPEQRVEESSR
jgi:hypothetical protein